MVLKPWPRESEEFVADMGIFRVQRLRTRSPRTGAVRSVTLLEAGDWVNVVALTPELQVVLVRQFRHGTREFTLEIPGGQVDAGESPEEAAARELREETGFAGGAPLLLGRVTPNPAFLDNHCHTFLIRDCLRVGEPQQDHGEDIEVLIRPLADIPTVVAAGEIDHALVICAFWWLFRNTEGGVVNPDPEPHLNLRYPVR